MSEFSLSSTTSKKTHFSSLLLSDFFLFCSFIVSHPLYFFYFIFFSPYIIKLLSFLSPLFITTSLLLLALITFSPNLVHESNNQSTDEFSAPKVSFIFGAYQAVVETLRSEAEGGSEEFCRFEELEAYKIVFEASNLEIGENPVEVLEVLEVGSKESCLESSDQGEENHRSCVDGAGLSVSEVFKGSGVGTNSDVVKETEEKGHLIEERKRVLGAFLHEKEEFEDHSSCQKVAKEVKPLSVSPNKVVEEQKEPSMRGGSKANGGHKLSEAKAFSDPKVNSQRQESNMWSSPDSSDGGYSSKFNGDSQNLGTNLGSFGSMRKEKEWRRTLACKLFEERHNVDGGGEGMDMLWETYERDSIKMQAKSKTKKGKKGSFNYYYDDEAEEEEGEEEEEEIDDGKLCCLQALKFSAGKMNLGMGRPNLVKISKALKGIGWLHHVSKHAKKAYHN